MFQHPRKNSSSAQGKSVKDLTRVIAPSLFLADERRQLLLEKMSFLSGLDAPQYENLCHILIENLVQYGQNLPETSSSYYSQPGGLVDHALNRTEAALSLFQEYLLQESQSPLSEEQKLWQYALYTAALLQGMGKLFVDYRVALYNAKGLFVKEWNPLLESLSSSASAYLYEFQKEAEIEFRRRLNLLMAKMLMPASGFAWIASNAEVLSVWLALLNEDEYSCGTLGALLIRAEAIAIQRYLLEFMNKGSAVYSGGRYRAGTFSGGQPETLLDKEQAIGMAFIEWMIQAFDKGIIEINKAPLFMVPGGMLMCAEAFQLFVREHPEYKNWQAVKNGFLSLGLHQSTADGRVMSRFETKGQIQTGIVFSKYALALPESVKVHLAFGKTESLSATELIYKAQFNSQFTQQIETHAAASLQQLNAAGQWQAMEPHSKGLKPGAKKDG